MLKLNIKSKILYLNSVLKFTINCLEWDPACKNKARHYSMTRTCIKSTEVVGFFSQKKLGKNNRSGSFYQVKIKRRRYSVYDFVWQFIKVYEL